MVQVPGLGKHGVMPYQRLLAHRRSEVQASYLVTFCCRQRAPLLRDQQLAGLVAEALREREASGHCSNQAWVLMPDHVHWLFTLAGRLPLSQVVGGAKAISSRAIRAGNPAIGRPWQDGYHEHRVRKDEDLHQLARYVIANPLRARLVTDLLEYRWWYAQWAHAPHGPAADGSGWIDLLWT
jgi:REP element-mobilizing transposase RayT